MMHFVTVTRLHVLVLFTQAVLSYPSHTTSDFRNERDISQALGDLEADVSDLVNDTSTLLSQFAAVIKALHDATNENDLVGLLNMNMTSSDGDDDGDDDRKTSTASAAVSTNETVMCPDMAVLFARGTAEAGNVGLFAGPSFFTALRNYINGTSTIAVQGIPYPATVAAFLAGGSAAGARAMAMLANRTATACPGTRLVLSGFSQGAQVVHKAAQEMAGEMNNNGSTGMAAAALSKVSSVVLFGDPMNGSAVVGVDAARVLSVCHAMDDICASSQAGVEPRVRLAHLTYSQDAAATAMFVMQRSRLGLMSGDAMNQGMGNVPVLQMGPGRDGAQPVGTGLGLPGM